MDYNYGKINEILKQTDDYKRFLQDVSGNFSHAYMLISNDKLLLKHFGNMLAHLLMCKNSYCGNCITCQKLDLGVHPDLIQLPNGQNVLTEDIKKIIDNSLLVPIESDKKIFIIDNFSSANVSAQNKLLKILEEPPRNTIIILLVDNENNVLPTISSRCRKMHLNIVPDTQIRRIIISSKYNGDIDNLVELSGGSLTRAINLTSNSSYVELSNVIFDVIKSLNSSSTVLAQINILLQKKADISEIMQLFEQYFCDILLCRLNKEKLIQNKTKLNDLKKLSIVYNPTMIDLIIKKIYLSRQQLKLNCNQVSILDSLLMYILEVKKKCSTL